jgi:hypothetical protein
MLLLKVKLLTMLEYMLCWRLVFHLRCPEISICTHTSLTCLLVQIDEYFSQSVFILCFIVFEGDCLQSQERRGQSIVYLLNVSFLLNACKLHSPIFSSGVTTITLSCQQFKLPNSRWNYLIVIICGDPWSIWLRNFLISHFRNRATVRMASS